MADPKEIIDFIAKSPIRVSVFGEFSAGKSTFLNALIGEEFLVEEKVHFLKDSEE